MKCNAYLAVAVVFCSVSPASASLLTNGSFEDVAVTAVDECVGFPWCIRESTSTPGWTQFGDGVDLIHNNYLQDPIPVLVDASDGVQFLDMNQAGTNGGIEQVVSADSGAIYLLELDTTAWAENSIGGTIGYELYDPGSASVLASGTFNDNAGGTWTSRTIQAAAVSSQIGVRIQNVVATQAGMGLDNVSLTQIPEPSSVVILLGLAVMSLYSRRVQLSRC